MAGRVSGCAARFLKIVPQATYMYYHCASHQLNLAISKITIWDVLSWCVLSWAVLSWGILSWAIGHIQSGMYTPPPQPPRNVTCIVMEYGILFTSPPPPPPGSFEKKCHASSDIAEYGTSLKIRGWEIRSIDKTSRDHPQYPCPSLSSCHT